MIHDQVKLPMSVAFGVVLQGIRIRLGRSLVTMMGVVLGIAFLTAMLTAQVASDGVAHEESLRAEARRMLNFLTAETGPVSGRTIGVVAVGPLNPAELRFRRRLESAGAQVAPGAPAEAVAIVVAGEGPVPTDLPGRGAAPGARRPILAATRAELAAELAPRADGVVVALARVLRPEELQRAEAAARRGRFRSAWIIVISLLVTVIGISNAMLMSVTERFREIGTMKCLGALSAFIRQMFLLDSILIGLSGALAGALLGAAFSIAVYGLIYGFGPVVTSLAAGRLAVCFALSVAAGVALSVVAALYPAHLAARMVPAAALRSNV